MTQMPKFLNVCTILFFCYCGSVFAETSFELTGGIGRFALDVDQKLGTQIEDNSITTNFTFGAYRLTDNNSWGAVLEYSLPISRDDLPGSGRILSFRPINYLSDIDQTSSYELYAGFAQFDWLRTANGYVFGANYRNNLFAQNSGLMLDVKYYQDLAYDSAQGDDIVDGFQTSLKFFYQF